MPEQLTQEQQQQFNAAFAYWRFDMWLHGLGSYETIEDKVERGELIPFECPKVDCDCRWVKVENV